MKAVVLLSGGLDSTVCMAVARNRGFDVFPISFNYQQRHQREVACAREVANFYQAGRHLVIDTNMAAIGGSALTDQSVGVPDGDVERHDIPVTYVPARNLIFLSYALGYAEVIGADHIFIGVNALDYSGYPDCRPEFIHAFEHLANLATKAGVEEAGRFRIHAPLIELTKADIIRTGSALGVDYGLTHSCYDPSPGGRPCERCDSCRLRAKGFAEAGLHDPALT